MKGTAEMLDPQQKCRKTREGIAQYGGECECYIPCHIEREPKRCHCLHADCYNIQHKYACNCPCCDAKNKDYYTLEVDAVYETFVSPLLQWIRKAGTKEYQNVTNWKLELKMNMMLYIYYGRGNEIDILTSNTSILNLIFKAWCKPSYTSHATIEITEDEMLQLIDFLDDIPYTEIAGMRFKYKANELQTKAKMVLKKYRLREYNVSLSVQCRHVVRKHFSELYWKMPCNTELVSRKIDRLDIPRELKKYIKSDRIEQDDVDIPPHLYLIVQWFATDLEKREKWDSFISRQYFDCI